MVELGQFGHRLVEIAVDVTFAHAFGVPAKQMHLPITPSVVSVRFTYVPCPMIDLYQKAARRIGQIRVNEIAGGKPERELSSKAWQADGLQRPRQSKFVVGCNGALTRRAITQHCSELLRTSSPGLG